MPMIGPRLKAARKAAGMSQKAVGDAAGLAQPYIAQLEAGDRTPSADTIRDLARVLGVSPGYLLGEEVRDLTGAYRADPRAAIVADVEAPPGLRALAEDVELCRVLGVTSREWQTLRAVPLDPAPSKDGYTVLLHTIRAVTSA